MIHEAGPVEGVVQRCARCGEVLASYRHVVVESPTWYRWWPVGACVEMVGGWNQEQVETRRVPDCPVRNSGPTGPGHRGAVDVPCG